MPQTPPPPQPPNPPPLPFLRNPLSSFPVLGPARLPRRRAQAFTTKLLKSTRCKNTISCSDRQLRILCSPQALRRLGGLRWWSARDRADEEARRRGRISLTRPPPPGIPQNELGDAKFRRGVCIELLSRTPPQSRTPPHTKGGDCVTGGGGSDTHQHPTFIYPQFQKVSKCTRQAGLNPGSSILGHPRSQKG